MPQDTQKPQLRHWLLLILLSIIWGSSFILIKRGLLVFNAAETGAIRVFWACIVLLPVAILKFKKIPKGKWKYILIMGLCGNFIPAFLFAKAQTQLASSLTGVLNALTPLFTFLIGIFVFKYGISKRQLTGLTIAFLGSFSLSFVSSDGSFGQINYYVFFVIAAAICYGISTNVIKVYLTEIPSLVLTSVAISLVGPISVFYLMTTDVFLKFETKPTEAWGAFGYLGLLGIMSTAIALVIFNRMIKQTSAVFASSVTYIIPVVAIFWGVWDGEQLLTLHYVGIFTTLVGVYITNRS
ncbi:DMT family transporter [Flexithrix dorotheae]|uniref:DMT family transporter n=1 Tax=Flexithrix dorotheae TaxID=70993 RepID=UPI0004775A58|nr:DMT family transporter [Flexithrix dorotheae]